MTKAQMVDALERAAAKTGGLEAFLGSLEGEDEERDAVLAVAEVVRRQEREACARIAEGEEGVVGSAFGRRIAARIREQSP